MARSFVDVVVLVMLAMAQRESAITGARLSVMTGAAAPRITIENLRDVPIEALRVDTVDADGRKLGSDTFDYCLSDPADRTPGRGRIQRHERRELDAPSHGGVQPRYVLSTVIFDDLSFEGNAAARDEILGDRTARAYEFAFAVDALKPIERISPLGVDAYLNGSKADWDRQLTEQGKAPSAASPLDEALRQARESPERFIAGAGAAYRAVLEQQLTRLRRHLPPGGIVGARLTIVDKSARTLLVTIENQRDSPLVDWYIESTWTSFSGSDVIPPHQRRQLSFELPDKGGPETRPAALVLAAFEDGYYEGHGAAFDRWVASRNERREDLADWVKVLMSAPRVSEPELRKFLAEQVTLRASRETHMGIRHVSDRVQEVTLWSEGTDIWPRFDRFRKDLEAEYLAITRVPPEKHPGPVETVTAATVVGTDMRRSVSYSAFLENLRDVPIEAFSVETYDLINGRAMGWTGSDFCTIDPAFDRPGRGRIMPHEKRDLGKVFDNGPTVPLLKLRYVLFDDLQFEGTPVARAQVLRAREHMADERAFALAALDEASGKPPSELEAFFVQKREAYLRQIQLDRKVPAPASQLESFIGTIRRSSPGRFAAEIPATRDRVKAEMARLRRHLDATPHDPR